MTDQVTEDDIKIMQSGVYREIDEYAVLIESDNPRELKQQILYNQKVVERVKELFADQKLLCGKYGGKKGYEKEYEVARNVLLKLQAMLDGKE